MLTVSGHVDAHTYVLGFNVQGQSLGEQTHGRMGLYNAPMPCVADVTPNQRAYHRVYVPHWRGQT